MEACAPVLCECGCGKVSGIWHRTDRAKGRIKGEAKRFLPGHNAKPKKPRIVVEDRGYESPCWVWQWALTQGGYGSIRRRAPFFEAYAHRHYYRLKHGPIEQGLELDHLCKIRRCVNPAHLEPVTSAENTRRGTVTKLKPWQVRAMRRAHEEIELNAPTLAKAFGVSHGCAFHILQRMNWRDV